MPASSESRSPSGGSSAASAVRFPDAGKQARERRFGPDRDRGLLRMSDPSIGATIRAVRENGRALMPNREEFSHQVRRTAIMTLAFAAALVFGIILLASSDWIPGGIIAAAAVVGLVVQIPAIRKLCSTKPPPAPPTSRPVR